ncbi:MAG: undecaprenyl-phosphate glucose phosphotransferase [Sphingobacteriales bacterium]|nr:MAG: undecaprenyl-phosphate glucose phosphotransferase [Sphingobacteriales bacterium]
MDKQFLRYMQISAQLLDLFILNTIVVLTRVFFDGHIDANAPVYFHFLIYLNISWIVLSWFYKIYGVASISSFETFTRKTKSLYIIWLCSVLIYLFFYRQFELSRYFILVVLAIFSLGLLLNRFAYIVVRDVTKSQGYLTKRILIVGYNPVGKKIMQKLEDKVNNKIVGIIEDRHSIRELTPYPVLGNVGDIIEVSQKFRVNQIFCTISPEQNRDIYQVMHEAESRFIRFRIIPDLSFFIKSKIHFEYYEGLPILSLRREPLEDLGNRFKKRVVDLTISFLVIIFVLSWLVPILGILIYLESPGPIFFSQLRSGRDNQAFRCLKFRSMKVNKEADKRQATRNDFRITKIGRIIRRTSLDEFPQFINVLKGEMSIVGPRPHMLSHTDEYSKIVDQYFIRQFLKPGITGWAQINGYRGEITNNEEITGRVECDLWYSEYWNPWLDFRIIFLTIYNIFRGEKNAY